MSSARNLLFCNLDQVTLPANKKEKIMPFNHLLITLHLFTFHILMELTSSR